MSTVSQRGGQAVAAFPARAAKTRRFSLGRPRSFAVDPEGRRVAFLRARSGTDPEQSLWVVDLASGAERCVADPSALVHADEDIPPEERARRERAREQAGGIVRFATDARVQRAVAQLGGDAVLADLTADGDARLLGLPDPVVDPRLDPTGAHLAWVRHGELWVADADGGGAHALLADDDPDVTWGLAEFVAAEEMGRTRGFWWAPDGDRLIAARVDVGRVATWHLADPVDPAATPTVIRYPAAGTHNADVALALVDLDGTTQPITWDHEALPYVVTVRWQRHGPPLVLLSSRDQRRLEVHTVDPSSGTATRLDQQRGAPWLEPLPGTPRWLPDKRLLTSVDDEATDTRRCVVDGEAVTPPWLWVRSVVDADADTLVVTASAHEPTEVGVWRVPLDGGEPQRLDETGGVTHAAGTVRTVVRQQARPDTAAVTTDVVRDGEAPVVLTDRAERPELSLNVEWLELGPRRLRAALLRPNDPDAHRDGDGTLPVLLDPYGGPHAQRVLRRRDAFLTSQWFAEQGFAVLVTDGRGSPGRGLVWERAVAGDLAAVPLADQVDGLDAALTHAPDLDGDRVAIRGWSFGGFLAALAVLRRPDRFHAAVAGAPVTDWRFYDTHYTERYLGHPDDAPDAYELSSLLGDAHRLTRPLLLIHGLADDNVVAAHTLRLSRALLEAGRPHQVLPLSGVTHMTPQETVAENLLVLQARFLRESLGLAPASSPRGQDGDGRV